MKRAVFYGFNQAKTEFTAFVIYGNRGYQQHKRYPVLKTGLKVKDIKAFVGLQNNSVLHLTTENDGTNKWYQTFDGPVVAVTASKTASGQITPDFTFTNAGGA